MHIRRVEPGDRAEWLRMRSALWPDCPPEQHLVEMAEISSPHYLESGDRLVTAPPSVAFMAVRPEGGLGGFLEASLRYYAEGCDTHPVGYVEGWYVDPDLRQQGVGAALVEAGESWARAHGCSEMASDCLLDNEASFRAHLALGYEEAERLIHFKKRLGEG